MTIADNAVLRYRDEKGAVSAMVLGGSDPRAIFVGNYHGVIIHVGMSGITSNPLPQLYVVGAGKISDVDGAAYARQLTVSLSTREAWIDFRADPWFISEIWRPFLPFFDATGPAPSEIEFKATKTLSCFFLAEANNKCSWQGIVKLP